jgi:hypothetical protein
MCGLFGFISSDGTGPNLGWLKRIALETQERGMHAFGFAWIASDGRLHSYKRRKRPKTPICKMA